MNSSSSSLLGPISAAELGKPAQVTGQDRPTQAATSQPVVTPQQRVEHAEFVVNEDDEEEHAEYFAPYYNESVEFDWCNEAHPSPLYGHKLEDPFSIPDCLFDLNNDSQTAESTLTPPAVDSPEIDTDCNSNNRPSSDEIPTKIPGTVSTSAVFNPTVPVSILNNHHHCTSHAGSVPARWILFPNQSNPVWPFTVAEQPRRSRTVELALSAQRVAFPATSIGLSKATLSAFLGEEIRGGKKSGRGDKQRMVYNLKKPRQVGKRRIRVPADQLSNYNVDEPVFNKTDDKRYSCRLCGNILARPSSLNQHWKSHFHIIPCSFCGQVFNRLNSLLRHQTDSCPQRNTRPQKARAFSCAICYRQFATQKELNEHLRKNRGCRYGGSCSQ